MENSHKMPNGARSAAGSSFAVVNWGWEAKGQCWRREGGAKERGKLKARRRPNRQRVEAASWINGNSGLGEAAVREREEWVRELESKIDSDRKREWVLINNNNKTINNII